MSPDLPASPADVAGRALGGVFHAISRARHAKSLHPTGLVFDATLRVDGGRDAPPAPLLRTPATHRALVRFSRSLGLPRPLPDLAGLAVRLLDVHGAGRHQDLLTTSSVDAPVAHHGFVPVADPQAAPYSSSLPYRAGGERFLVGFMPLPSSPRPPGADFEERLQRAAATGELRFAFAVAPLLGRFRPIGELAIGVPQPAAANGLRFDPWNTGGGLEPAGVLNRMRRAAYPRSQEDRSGEQTRGG